MTQSDKALGIAMAAHANQFRRDGVTPYIMHPLAVASKVKEYGDRFMAVAFAHDALEDNKNITPAHMSNVGIDDDVIDAVELLTKKDGVDYETYIQRIKQNEMARVVKIADMLHNLSENPTVKQIRKYSKALLILTDGVE
jgi:(p)ppGpp synthase/HD superfamily hydrolase